MILPIKSYTIAPIDIVREKTCINKKSNNNSPHASNIDKVSAGENFHFVSYQKSSQEFYEPLVQFVDNLVTHQREIHQKIKDESRQDEINNLEKKVLENDTNGIENAAEKIVDFAKRLSGDDNSKVGQIKNAVKKGFKQAGTNVGQLPELAQKTLESIMKKLDSWYLNK